MELFEQAAIHRLRFPSGKGSLTTEDLYSLSLQDLNTIGMPLVKQLKDQESGSLISTATTDKKLQLAVDVIKHIISYKQAAQAKAKERADKTAQLSQLKELHAQKKFEALSSQGIDVLEKQIAELEAAI